MIDPGSLFDSYGRRARLYPALLTLAPLVAVILGWLSEWPSALVGTLIAIASACGLFYLLANFARGAGRNVEKRLLAEWGGWPTTIILRHRDGFLPQQTKARYHAFLAGAGATLPTAAQEASAPDDADGVYVSAVQWLKEQRRASEYKLVHRENAEYGFRRNLRGLKSIGIGLCLAALLGWLAVAFGRTGSQSDPSSFVAAKAALTSLPVGAWLALGVVLLWLFGWIAVVRDAWVRDAGDQYAAALLATCDAPKTSSSAN